MRRNLEASHYLFFSQRVLLALVESGLSRDDAYRLVQRNAMRAWDEELDFRELVRARRRDRVARRPRRSLRPRARTRATSTRSSPVSAHSPSRRNRFMPEATHVASGKVRELYALDDDRLLLVASDRISTFDVDPPDRDPGQGPRAHRPLRLLVHAPARDRPESHARDPRRRPLDGVPAARDAADRVRRARLPRRLGLEGLPGDRHDVGPRACPRGCASRTSCPTPIFTPATKAQTGHDENIIARRGRRARRRRSGSREVERVCIALYTTAAEHARDARDHHRRHEVRARPRRRRQARARRRGAHARLVPLLARGRRTSRDARRTASTSSSSATTASRRAGTRPTPAPSCRTTSSRTRARSTSRRSSG